MAKSSQIKKFVNGEIADADEVNQAIEDAGAEGGLIPYDPTTEEQSVDGSQSIGSTAFPFGSLKINRDAELVEVDPLTHTAASNIAWKNLRNFIYLKDAPSTYVGNTGKFVRVNAGETALEFSNPVTSQLFTGSGTFVCPAGITKVYITMIGGGGGGAGASTGSGANGGGGGSGAYCIDVPFDVVGGNSYTVTIGAGGAGGVAASGSNGGSSSFDSLSVAGGNGGVSGSSTTADGGVGGVGNQDFTTTVANSASSGRSFNGRPGARSDNAGQYGGTGASSPYGACAGNSGRNTTGNAASGYGAGGGGCWTNASNQTGGAGASGFCLVKY